MKLTALSLALACAFGLAACGSAPTYDESYRNPPAAYYGSEYGRVIGIETVAGDRRTTGAGAVIGGVLGGVLGHQVGSGRGNDAATVAGAVGGAVVGNEMERRRATGDVDYRVDVRLENGRVRSFLFDSVGDLRVGDRVRVDGDRVDRL
jgi:outer membrane lipoprotein SlyB